MYQTLNLFQVSGAMAEHAGRRQAVVATNVANADTPRFQAMQMPSFQALYAKDTFGAMRATRSGHVGEGANGRLRTEVMVQNSEPSPNGNTVSIEDEMLSAVDIAREHNRALAIYRHGMTILRASIGQR